MRAVPPFTPEEREHTAARVEELLRDDPRVEGVVLAGSLAAQPDHFSDVDLIVLVTDGVDHAAFASEWVERLSRELPVVHGFETAFGETIVRGLLLENLLEVDLAFVPAASFVVWGPVRALFDRSGLVEAAMAAPVTWDPASPDWAGEAGFAWHDVLHAFTAARRGRRWQALWYLGRIRNRTLALAQERRGFYADFCDYADDLPAEELAPLEATLPASLAPEALLAAIEAATVAFLAELRRGDAALAKRLEAPLLDLVRARSVGQ